MCGWGKKIAYIRFVQDGSALCWHLAEDLESGTAARATELQTAWGSECNEDKWVPVVKVEAVMNAGTLNAALIGLEEVGFLSCMYINVHYSGLQATLSVYWKVWVFKALCYCLGPWIWHWFHVLASLVLTTKHTGLLYKSKYFVLLHDRTIETGSRDKRVWFRGFQNLTKMGTFVGYLYFHDRWWILFSYGYSALIEDISYYCKF